MDNDSIIEAVQALRTRGVNHPEQLLELAEPEQILAACRRWDTQTGVTPGLLVTWIRAGEFTAPEPEPTAPTKSQQLRATHAAYARRYPVGTVVETHRRLVERKWPADLERDDPCPGDMVVWHATYPLLVMRCDECGFEAGLPVHEFHRTLGPLLAAVPDQDPDDDPDSLSPHMPF